VAGRAVATERRERLPPGPARICRLCGPACPAPGPALVQGSADHPLSCCDHVWDGYCQEKARRYARVGITPRRTLRRERAPSADRTVRKKRHSGFKESGPVLPTQQ